VAAAASPSTTILLDGYPLPFPTPPVIVKGTTMVPFRAISEAMGVDVQWDGATRTISAVQSDGQESKSVQMMLNNPQLTVNGQAAVLAVAPFEQNGSTLIPV